MLEDEARKIWRVVVRYDDPRGGIWRGPLESRKEAERRLYVEAARVHGSIWVERLIFDQVIDNRRVIYVGS